MEIKQAIKDLNFQWLIENSDGWIRQEVMNIAMAHEENKIKTVREYEQRMKVHDIKYGRYN